ncbi:MAG: glycosyltransferase [Chthonomonadaceae bacterium]|nr:glycosyltransferase [Chthonomonadaceae bacterium]
MEFRRVSVIIPASNAEKTLEQAIRSAWEQSRPPDEIVVGDDGSTDGTAALAETLGAHVVRLPKGNGAIARNQAVDASTGDLLLFLDADDWWKPTKVEAHLRRWSEAEASFIFDTALQMSAQGQAVGPMGAGPDGPVPWEAFLEWTTWTSGSSFSVPRSRYREMGGFREELVSQQDVDFWVRCAAEAGQAERISAPHTFYRLSPDGVSKRPRDVEANLRVLLSGWPFASDGQKDAFFQLMALTAAGFTPFPDCIQYLRLAGWPVHRPKFWRALARSLRAA